MDCTELATEKCFTVKRPYQQPYTSNHTEIKNNSTQAFHVCRKKRILCNTLALHPITRASNYKSVKLQEHQTTSYAYEEFVTATRNWNYN